MKPVVFIHTNDRQLVGAIVSAYSFQRNSAQAERFEVRIVNHRDFPFFAQYEGRPLKRGAERRPWVNEDLQSFTPLRFAPPGLMEYRGRALVVDPDVFAAGDVWPLLDRDMAGHAILCRWRPPGKGFPGYWASSVMLLDCARLTHWDVPKQFDELFCGDRDYLKWVHLEYEPAEAIGQLEPEWNDFDHLDARTRLLHTTKRRTQPWKTGLPVDYTHQPLSTKRMPKRLLKMAKQRLGLVRPDVYHPHPDPAQEQFFFGLLRECLERGLLTEDFLRAEMARDHIRHDALEVLARTPPVALPQAA